MINIMNENDTINVYYIPEIDQIILEQDNWTMLQDPDFNYVNIITHPNNSKLNLFLADKIGEL